MRLHRTYGLFTATSVVIANIIGTGIFTTTGLILERLESGWLVLACWLLGGLIALCGALSYAELATIMPQPGGEYLYLRRIYGPLPAFLSGWTSFFVGFSAPTAAAGVAVAYYLQAAGVLGDGDWVRKSTALALVLLFTLLHYGSLTWGAGIQNVLTALKIVLIVGLVTAGFLWGSGSFRFASAESAFWTAGRWSNLGSSMLLVMFAYSGWNASVYLAGEVKKPESLLPRSLLLGTVTVMILYFLLNLLFFYAAPIDSLKGVIPVAEAATATLFGEGAAPMLSVAIALALLSSLSAYILVGPRVYYAMARDGVFFRFAAQIHPRFRTPAYSIAAQGACAGVMILTGTFEQLLLYIGFALGIFPWLTVAGVILLRRRKPELDRPYRVWGYPLIPGLYLFCSSWILAVAFVNSPVPSLLALLTVAAGIPAYRLTLKARIQRGKK